MAESPRGRLAITIVVAVVAIVLIGIPAANLVAVAFGDGPGALVAALSGPLAARAIANSLWVAALVTVLALVTGTAAALVTERVTTRGRGLLRAGMLAQLLVPPFVLAFGWTRAYGPRGLTDQALGLSVPGLYGPIGIMLVVTVAATPLAWLVVAAALATRAELELELAARASGAGPARTFVTITLPLLRPAIAAAAAVTFVFALNAFGVPEILGAPAGFATITTRLYSDLALSSSEAAFARAIALAATLVVVAVVVVASVDALVARAPATRTGAGGSAVAGARRRWPVVALVAWIAVTTVVPLLATLLTALTRAVGLPPVPANWTLANFGDAISDGQFAGALLRSLLVAAVAASVVLVLGALVAAGMRSRRARAGGLALTLGFAVPGSALAVAVLLAYGGILRNTLLIIGVAYVAKFWVLGHRQLSGSLDRVPLDALWAARASGAGRLETLRTIAVPILRPSLVAAWVVVFVFGLHELTMSTLLYGPGTSTLAVHVLNVEQLGDPTISAALGVILVLLVAVAAVPLLALGRGRIPADAPAVTG